MAPPELSVVLPVYNEVESLGELWRELGAVLDALGHSAEVIFIDDGSTDGSVAALRRLRDGDPRIRLVRLSDNRGLSSAFAAGLGHARGAIVVTMDSDLQSDPSDIPLLLAGLKEADAACGWRQVRRDPWLKRVSSRIANGVRTRVLGDSVRDSACSLRAMRRECLGALTPFHGFHRFIPTLLLQAGFRVVEVPVHHRPRRYGASHYGVRNRAWRAFVDLLGVRWLRSRRLRFEASEEARSTASVCAAGSDRESSDAPRPTLGVREGYDRWSAFYDVDGNPLLALEERHVPGLIGDVAGLEVADVGCGTGRHAVRLAAAGARVTALDFSERMLEAARRKAGNGAIRFVAHDVTRPLPLPDAAFDRVLCCLVADHVTDLPALYRELARVCARRAGAAVIVSSAHPALTLRGVQARFHDPRTGERAQIESTTHQVSDHVAAALRAGLRVEHVSEHLADAALAATHPRAEKYVGWPLLLVLKAVPR